MAKCDEGYRCSICGEYVERLEESDLYLRYVIGELDPELLHTAQERHILCNPVLAQFIEPSLIDYPEGVPERAKSSLSRILRREVRVTGPFAKENLAVDFVQQRSRQVTSGYNRLLELANREGVDDITTYPLPEAVRRYRGDDE